MSAPRLLRQREVVALLGISRQAFWKLRSKGFFPAVKLGPTILRWRQADVDEWLERGNVPKAKKPVLAALSESQMLVAKRTDRRAEEIRKKREAVEQVSA